VRFAVSLADEVRYHNVQPDCAIKGDAYTTMTDESVSAGERNEVG
jgi:hypothetical protein